LAAFFGGRNIRKPRKNAIKCPIANRPVELEKPKMNRDKKNY
jgi:hypothetical protein